MLTRKPEDDTGAARPAEVVAAPATLPLRARPLGESPPAMPARPGSQRPEIVRRARDYGVRPGDERGVGAYGGGESKRLIVGRDIALSGEISSCEKLVVEGRVEANITDCREIEIAETGTFRGEATIDVAVISGLFEGTLTVRDLLILHSTGRILGTVRYGKIEIERGGRIDGDMRGIDEEADARISGGAA